MASVTFDHVVKRYTADLTVVKDFNVEVKDKEFMVLVGPSGCGKSTALRMLAGLEQISEGRILIGERVVNNVAAKDRDIAMVFQSYALYPHMSVYDNMAFPLQMAKMTWTPSCAGRRGSSCRSCTATWRRPSSTSRTTRSRR